MTSNATGLKPGLRRLAKLNVPLNRETLSKNLKNGFSFKIGLGDQVLLSSGAIEIRSVDVSGLSENLVSISADLVDGSREMLITILVRDSSKMEAIVDIGATATVSLAY